MQNNKNSFLLKQIPNNVIIKKITKVGINKSGVVLIPSLFNQSCKITKKMSKSLQNVAQEIKTSHMSSTVIRIPKVSILARTVPVIIWKKNDKC